MSVSRDQYRLLEQQSVTPDYVGYRAEEIASAVEVEVLLLKRTDEERWRRIVRRLRLAQLAAHDGIRKVLHLGLQLDEPFAVLAAAGPTNLRSMVARHNPVPAGVALNVMEQLATILAAAHRVGLCHGELSAERVAVWPSNTNVVGRCELDFVPFTPNAREDFAADIRQLGELWQWLAGPHLPSAQQPLLARILAADRFDRPAADEVLERIQRWRTDSSRNHRPPQPATDHPPSLAGDSGPRMTTDVRLGSSDSTGEWSLALAAESGEVATTVATGKQRRWGSTDPLQDRQQLGRFRLMRKLGEGGMGAVYQAEDPLDGRVVAVKVLRSDLARNETSRKRFHREARMLAEFESPYVANLLEVNEDDGLQYLVMEYVAGQDVLERLRERGRLSETESVAIAADVARALREAHLRGIVHRDLKPENIMLVGESSPAQAATNGGGVPQVKLTDFGLARELRESESQQVTLEGALLGTPLYMSPEQCSGQTAADVRSDVYALGAALFHMLTGRPPFEGNSTASIIAKHINEPAPLLRTLRGELSEAIEQIVAKCLTKSPDSRYQNAGELLHDLERLQRGEPTTILAHPQFPVADAREVMSFDFMWELTNSPERLWPHVSNTERLNRAIGLPAVEYEVTKNAAGGSHRSGQVRKLGLKMAWQEHPFEWIEGRRMGVLREFRSGPMKWLTSVVELLPRSDGGTTLVHRIRLLPANLIGRTVAKIEIGVKTRKALQHVYARIDAALSGELGSLADPFEDAQVLPPEKQHRLEERLQQIVARGVEPLVAERLGEYLASAPPQELARIRPVALARRLSVDERQLVAACLHGAREGLLTMLWDILCPICRIPSQVQDSLKMLREHGHCPACQTEFELDFANSIELIFRISPEIHPCETGVFCIGGPAHSPHVAVQVRLAPGERFTCDLGLAEGAYRLRGPQLPYVVDLRVVAGSGVSRWELNVARGPSPDQPRVLQANKQIIVLTNDQPQELVAKIERVAPRADALTAARAAATPLFRELFPGECLSANQLIRVEQVTLLLTRLDRARQLYFEVGDARAFERIHDHLRELDAIVRREGGALVKTLSEGIQAVFAEPLAAVRAGLAMQTLAEPSLRVAIHRGPAMVATLNDHLDYFGSTVSAAEQLLAVNWDSEQSPTVLLGNTTAADESIAATLASLGFSLRVGQPLPGLSSVWPTRIEAAKQ